MAQFPALPLWTDALLGDTLHLTPAQFGAYLRLLIVAWRRPGCDLPNDDVFLGRVVGDPKNWWRLKPVVLAFFAIGEDGLLRQKRLSREREFTAQRAEQQRSAGRASALKRNNVASTSVPTPLTTPISKKEDNPPIVPPAGGPKAPKRVSKTILPEDFPADKDRAWAQDHWAGKGRADLQDSLDDEIRKFRDHHTAKATTSASWPASWRTWAQNAVKFNEVQNGRGRQKPATANDKWLAGAALALQRRRQQEAAGPDETGVPLLETGREPGTSSGHH